MRGLKSTLALVLIAAGLGGYIYFVDSDRPSGGTEERAKVFTVEADKIQEMRITSGGETTVLKKAGDAWKITEPVEADADATEVSSLTSNIATLEQSRVLDENATDLAQYGLAQPPIEVAFSAEGNVSGRIAFGEKTPTQGDLYAVTPGTTKVFLVPAFAETTFAKKTFDLRDKRVLRIERDKIDALEIVADGSRVAAKRDGSEWTLTAPFQGRADYAAVEAILTRLNSAAMSELVATPPAGAFDKPAFSLTASAGSTRATLTVTPTIDGTIYARDEARGMTFTIEDTLRGDLQRTADDLRDKDLFEFRPFNADSVRITQGKVVVEVRKVPASGDSPEKWQKTVNGQTGDVEAPVVDDLLTKLSGLRAQSFTTAAPQATDSTVTVAVSYDGGKFERVRVHSNESEPMATREGEPGAAKLDVNAVGEALKAIDVVTTPPAAKQ